MKTGQLFIGLLFGLVFGWGISTFLAKNKAAHKTTVPTNTEPAKWEHDEKLDALKAAPNSHAIIYEDSSIRVLKVTLDEHKTEPVHTHKYKSVMWFTQATPMVYYTCDISNNSTIKDSSTIPQMPADALNVGGLLEKEGPHAVKNAGDKKGIAYRVEFKKDFK